MADAFGPANQKSDELRVMQRQQSLSRIYTLIVVFLAGFVLVVFKLFVIQVQDAERYRELGKQQYESREIISPSRGLILDRNLSILASNITEYSLVADPTVIEQPDTVARYLSRFLPGSYQTYLGKLRDTTRRFITLEKRLSEDVAQYFSSWKCYGVILLPQPRRRYNFNALAGTVLGYTNVDNNGQSGIELELENELAGQEGYIVYQRNARGIRRPDVEYPRKEPVNGYSIVLTIHQAYQAIAEEELAKGVEQFAAESGRCIVLQPKTGEVLAMANYPSIDPNNLAEYSPEKARNRCITDLYEPGSTFKLVAMSAALNENIHKPEDRLNAENGTWSYSAAQKPIKDDHPYGWLTLQGAFEHSSNIISAKLADKLGVERFYKYARNFGFGIQTGIELPGELRGDLRKPIDWDGTTLKYLAFGYGLAVTSLQIACAYAALANDGVLMRPFIRKWMLDDNRNIIDETVPQTVRRVVSSETAATMRAFMNGVVDSGTAKLARIEGISIGGKTGTSQRLVNGSYSDKSHVASFVGFFPVEDPRILILVILDAPKNGYYGGAVAAPIFRQIAMRIINTSTEFAKKSAPVFVSTGGGNQIRVPNIIGLRIDAARALLTTHGFHLTVRGVGDVVAKQSPEENAVVQRGETIDLLLESSRQDTAADGLRVPDVMGMTVRQAMSFLRCSRLAPSAVGGGIVRDQIPKPGETLQAGGRVTIICEPRRIYTANIY